MKHSNVAFFVPHMGCPHACSFCDQHSISGQLDPPVPEEIQETCIKALTQISQAERAYTEIAFFGGSFTAIERGEMLNLLNAAEVFCGEGLFAGIRISTRPDAISQEILECLKKHKVSAIELGVQSMDNEVLCLNRRGHTAEDAVKSAALIRKYGFSLGLQMMTGLYGDSPERTYRTAEQLIAMQPDTVRIYPTVVMKGTGLCELYETGKYRPPGVETSIPLVADLIQRFEEADIRVIRVGLHASPELEKKVIAGAYHPAFRELCEGEIYYRNALKQLEKTGFHRAEAWVAPTEVSKMVGQSRRNLTRLLQNGFQVTVKQAVGMHPFEVKIQEVKER